MDSKIEELKELVRQNIALSQETHKIVRSMRAAHRMNSIFKLLWIVLVIALSVGAYYYFAPYLAQILSLYDAAQHAIQQAQQIGSSFSQPQ